MHKENGLTLLFVINPSSGSSEKPDWESAIRDHFRDTQHRIEFYELKGENDEEPIRQKIKTLKPDRAVAVGGDGTVKMLAGIVMDTELSMAILPAGSANGMARELKIPDKPEEALRIITDGECRKLDLIRINKDHICLHLSDIGLNAKLVKYFEQSGKRGMWGYARLVFRVLWERRAIHAKIRTDTGEVQRSAFMIVIANAKTYGTGAIINPEGKMNDGLFEIIVVRRISLAEIFKMVVTHKPYNPERTEVFQTKSVTINTRHRAYFQIDGELIGKLNAVEAQALPQSVYMMLPAGAVDS